MNSPTPLPDTRTFAPEEPVPGYHLYEKLGEGAFGQVFRAAGPGDVPAALKILDLGTSHGKTEFRALEVIKRLNCPNMVPIFGFWLKDATGRVLSRDELYAASGELRQKLGTISPTEPPSYQPPLKLIIAMGLGDQTLSRRLKQCRSEGLPGIPVGELLRYMEDAARAIDFLGNPQRGHAAVLGGVQHGDIKPANMLIVANGLQICDYGLARMLSDQQRTRIGGTPAYLAPESFKTRQLGTAADQYALAISYAELRTGSLPFPEDSSLAQVMSMHCDGTLDFSGLEPAERAVIQRATSAEPADRFATSEQMVQALRAAVEPRPPAAAAKRSYAPLSLTALVALLATILATWFLAPRADPPPPLWLPNGREQNFHVVPGVGSQQFEGRSYANQIEYENGGVRFALVLVVPPAGQTERPFYISENKVTNELFAIFAAEDPAAVAESRWKAGRVVEGEPVADADAPRAARLPVFNVTWDEARRCAQWLGGRLPTSGQWDIAAGRDAGREGPYQGEWDPTSPTCARVAVGRRGPLDVDAGTDDVSPAGCRHMSGNGYEWTRTNGLGDEVRSAKRTWTEQQIQLRGQDYHLDRPLIFIEANYALEFPTDAAPWISFRIVLDDLTDKPMEAPTP